MSEDNEFEPHLGKIGSRAGKHRFVSQVRRATQGAALGVALGRFGRARRKGKATRSRFGRGRRASARLVAQSRRAGMRRVVIKARVVKLAGKPGGARAHLAYLQRDGVTRDGERGRLYNATTDEADGKVFLDRGAGDRHQFRFIVSPEDAADLTDLKAFTRDLMAQMERDLGTRLDWVAVDHFNTDNPHTHIVLRGVDETGADLVIARDYIARGLRERASELVTRELGPQTAQEIHRKLAAEVEADRFTRLDRALQREAARDALGGVIDLRPEADGPPRGTMRALLLSRLEKLERLGLAEPIGPGQWRLAGELETTLRVLGERGDIIKTLHRALGRSAGDYAIADPARPGRIVGRVVEKGLADELAERPYLIVDGIDGRAHYLRLGAMAEIEDLPTGGIVEIRPAAAAARPSDRTIAAIARDHDGVYAPDQHLAALRAETGRPHADPETFVEAHLRRLEALRRGGVVERLADGRWQIPDDYLQRARRYGLRRRHVAALEVRVLSALPLNNLATAEGATWLDRQLVGREKETLAETGFGRVVREALDRRVDHLIEEELAQRRGMRVIFATNLLGTLRDRELAKLAAGFAEETGMDYRPLADGDRIEGIYRRRLALASGPFALIDNGREFSLVPWRPILERSLEQRVSGVARGGGISWEIARGRGLGIG
jgi:type IV secretory pathway VirD2 relaxase